MRFLLILAALPHATPFRRPAACHACVPDSIREELAIGFHLGQSYGTAVSYLDNGTAVNLAKVAGSARYVEIMELTMQAGSSPWKRCWNFGRCGPFDLTRGDFRVLRRFLGFAGTPEAAVFADMVLALKTASEKVLGPVKPIKCVVVGAPWMKMWRGDHHTEMDLVDAVRLAGLEPCPGAGDMNYIGEGQAVLGANELWTCQPCNTGGSDTWVLSEGMYYMSFTNRSLYTDLRAASCFYWENVRPFPTIDGTLGLDQLDHSASPADFWQRLEDGLMEKFIQYHDAGTGAYQPIRLVVVSGEAAETPEFLAIVRRLLPAIRERTRAEDPDAPLIDLVVSKDPAYAGARGAALWQRMRMEYKSYCNTEECSFQGFCGGGKRCASLPWASDAVEGIEGPPVVLELPEKEEL